MEGITYISLGEVTDGKTAIQPGYVSHWETCSIMLQICGHGMATVFSQCSNAN